VGADATTEPAERLHGLRPALTSFVGRAGAVDTVAGLLGKYRLVTVTGPGGMGKTRLADEVARQVAVRFAEGVWVVELATIAEPGLVPAAAATVLGLRQAPGMSVMEALGAYLARQQLLLILDNCEHVLEAAAQFCAAVLLSADDVRILATSREPLGLAGEARYRLPPLALPGRSSPGGAVASEAVALFVDRARQLDPHFTLDDESSAVVARLVARLDGLPLAIELAAARAEALGLTELAGRLDDRFRLLVSAQRGAVARQRSLEATFGWSYQLLSASEQHVLRHLSVFPGPFTLDAAMAVAGSDAGPGVLHLVDCSLLTPPRTGPDGRSRYSMLETLRAYARDRLKDAGEEHVAGAALAAHVLQVAEQAATGLASGDGELAAAQWLDAEDAAIYQGMAWSLDYDPPAALRLAVALAPWWRLRGRWIQGTTLLQRAAERAGPEAGAWYAAQVWMCNLSQGTANYDTLLGHYSAVAAALRDQPASVDLVDSLTGRSAALRNLGRLAEATADARNALAMARQIGYVTGEHAALTELSLASVYAGDGADALEWARQVQQIDLARIPGWVARNGGGVLLYALIVHGPREASSELYAEAVTRARAAGDLVALADCLYLTAVLALQTGRPADAGEPLRETLQISANSGKRLRVIDALDECGYLCALTGRYAEAVTLWSARDVHSQASGLADTPFETRRREAPSAEARRSLGERQYRTAHDRGAALTLTAAVELAVMMTGETAQGHATASPGKLSSRERELVALVARGHTDAQIAEQLFISVRTVRTHLDRIRDKSGCRRRADLTRLALQEGIV
jgi:predicted ATPase/DNA-binding CsgD family transcriptional regulator